MKLTDPDKDAIAQRQSEQNKRKWVRREVDFYVSLIFPTQGVRSVCAARFMLKDLSEGGASIFVGSLKNTPDFFYMQFGDEKSEMFGCYVVNRRSDTVHCQFWKEMTSKFIDLIIADKELAAIFDELVSVNPKAQLEADLLNLLKL